MTDRYAVIGCSSCDNLQVVALDGAETVTCSRCQTVYPRDARKHLASAATADEAREAYGRLNAEGQV